MKSEILYALRELVSALDNAFISTWQSTADWQKELDYAKETLRQFDEQEERENGSKSS